MSFGCLYHCTVTVLRDGCSGVATHMRKLQAKQLAEGRSLSLSEYLPVSDLLILCGIPVLGKFS